LMARSISWWLLMTTQDTHGFISSRGRVRLNKLLLLCQWSSTLGYKKWQWHQVQELHLGWFLVVRGSNNNIPLHIPLNKMMSPRGRTRLLWMVQEPWWRSSSVSIIFGPNYQHCMPWFNWLNLHKILHKTSYKILISNKPNLKTSGCKCFLLKQGVWLSKFQTKAMKGIFVLHLQLSHL
jgi:hypothetical protein